MLGRLLSLAALLFSVAVALLISSLSTFEGGPHGGPRPIAPEAVPVWRTSELHWFLRYFLGYVFGAVAPVSTMTACPTVVDRADGAALEEARECMKRGRALEVMDDFVDLASMFDVEVVEIDRPKDPVPMKVTLLRKQISSREGDGPLILYMHGGGFTIRGSKNDLAARIFGRLLEVDGESESSVMDGAAFAIVDYRLAPEHVYPAAIDDCLLALNHLVKIMGLGKGGVHVAGISAGATLAMETTLKSKVAVDTFYVDAPVVALPTGNEGEWSMDSPSWRRYSYTRNPPVLWVEWSLKAYLGMDVDPEDEKDIPIGTTPVSVDITGGAMTVSEWTKRKSRSFPKLLLVTSLGDPLRDGGLAFKDVYEKAIVRAKERKGSPGMKHFETSSGHVGFYYMEPSAVGNIMKEWHSDISAVWETKGRKY